MSTAELAVAAAVERVLSLARSWASLRGDDTASETGRHLGLLILGKFWVQVAAVPVAWSLRRTGPVAVVTA